MGDTGGSRGEYRLDGEGVGWVSVSYQGDMVWVMSCGERVGLGCEEALRLLGWLQQHRAFLVDHAKNVYECRECGSTHAPSVLVCPALLQSEEGIDGGLHPDDMLSG